MSSAHAREAVDLLSQAPIRRLSAAPLVEDIWLHRRNLTPYDGAYVALAERLACPLLTADRGPRISAACRGRRACGLITFRLGVAARGAEIPQQELERLLRIDLGPGGAVPAVAIGSVRAHPTRW